MRRLLPLLALSAASAALLAGCSNGTSTTAAPAPSGTGTVGTAPVTTPATTAPTRTAAAAPSTESTTTTGGTSHCTSSDLNITKGTGGGAAGTWSLNLVFTNKSSNTCTLYGYPGVSWVTGDNGTQVGDPLTRDSSTPKKTVTLASGAVAHVQILVPEAGNYDTSKCVPVEARGLRIYPPDETASKFLALPTQVCSVKGVGVGRVQTAASGKGTEG